MPSDCKSIIPRRGREILIIYIYCMCHQNVSSMRARTWSFVRAVSPGPREGLAGSGCSILGR